MQIQPRFQRQAYATANRDSGFSSRRPRKKDKVECNHESHAALWENRFFSAASERSPKKGIQFLGFVLECFGKSRAKV